MLRQIKPKTARSKRHHASTLPLPIENPKRTLFLRGTSSSSLLNTLLTDLHSLRAPSPSLRLYKKNECHPFEDATTLEFLAGKNDASLVCFASHSKKRPHCLTWVRLFGGRVLEMVECGVVGEGARGLRQFAAGGGKGVPVGVRPMVCFSGGKWEGGEAKWGVVKSLLMDFFRGGGEGSTREVDVEGLQFMISFFVEEEDEGGKEPVIQMRCWRIVTRRGGSGGGGGKVPRVEVVETGPRIDMRIGRVKEAEPGMWKEAMRKGGNREAKVRKNVETDRVGDQIGRIHLGRQDLGELQSRKMKGLKRGRDEGEGDKNGVEEEDVVSEDEGFEDENDDDDDDDDDDEREGGGVPVKRQKVA